MVVLAVGAVVAGGPRSFWSPAGPANMAAGCPPPTQVKLTGAIVSDQPGEQQGLDNAGAVEHVHDISFRHGGFGASSVFDVRNHV